MLLPNSNMNITNELYFIKSMFKFIFHKRIYLYQLSIGDFFWKFQGSQGVARELAKKRTRQKVRTRQIANSPKTNSPNYELAKEEVAKLRTRQNQNKLIFFKNILSKYILT